MPVFDCNLNSPHSSIARAPGETPPGALPFPRLTGKAGRLLDANGVHIPWVIRADTETGVVESYERVDGRFIIDPTTLRLVVKRALHPAPLQYVFLEADTPFVVAGKGG